MEIEMSQPANYLPHNPRAKYWSCADTLIIETLK